MTSTIEDAFGSCQMVDGFILNNQLLDFSFASVDADGPVANRVEAGKHPRSAMLPTVVFDKTTDKLVLTVVRRAARPLSITWKVRGGTLDLGPERAAGEPAAQLRQPQRAHRVGIGALPAHHH